MEIYITGVDMPKSCTPRDCFVRTEVHEDGTVWCPIAKDYIGDAITCPLVPVPPHGGLIDADKLRQSIKESIDECHKWANEWAYEAEGGEMYARVSQALGTFIECSLRVKAAPIVIPASEEGK